MDARQACGNSLNNGAIKASTNATITQDTMETNCVLPPALFCTQERASDPPLAKHGKNEANTLLAPYANSSCVVFILYLCSFENKSHNEKLMANATIAIRKLCRAMSLIRKTGGISGPGIL